MNLTLLFLKLEEYIIPNNIFIDAIKPSGEKCRVCGGELSSRADDQDEAAIDKRHDIYYDTKTGTLTTSYTAYLVARL